MTLTRIVLTFAAAAAVSSADQPSPGLQAYAGLPLTFEINQGQTDARVKYLARGIGYTTFLTGGEAVISFAEPSAVVRLTLNGASFADPAGLDQVAGKSNYIIGSDPARWRTG